MDWTSATPARRVTVRFLDDEGRTVSHWNKLLKGSLVRWLLTEQPAGPEDLAGFQHPLGYRFDARSSDLDATLAAVRSEEHTSELQSLMRISYAVFCLKTQKKIPSTTT